MISSEEIKNKLWNGANELRGSMDASRYKDYMLGLMFYKFLSDKTLQSFAKISDSKLIGKELYLQYKETVTSYNKEGVPLKDNLIINAIGKYQGYYILPDELFQSWQDAITKGEFELQKVQDALFDFEKNIVSENNINEFKGLFSGMNLTEDAALGSSLKVKNENITALIELFSDLNLPDLLEQDVVGDIYEYLIGKFAMEAGAKAGEFYTPHYVSELIANLVAVSVKNVRCIYDPAVGSGSLLLKLKNHLSDDAKKTLRYYGQDKNTTAYNLCRMNLLLHGVKPENIDIRNGDTLGIDWPDDPTRPGQGILFDAVMMNPPYSLKKWNKSGINNQDPRFEFVGGILPPDGKGDYAFLAHGLFHLNTTGAMGIVLPHGVLFRGASEGEIRKILVDKNCIDAIIGLPEKMFTNTDIPVLVMILKKNRNSNEPTVFIDASKESIKVGKQNILLEKHIAKITDAYIARKEIPNFCHLASREEIIKNEYNLNISRYIEPETNDKFPDDVDAHLLGGIPSRDLEKLQFLNQVIPNFVKEYFDEIRPCYLSPKIDFGYIKSCVLNSEVLSQNKNKLNSKLDSFIEKYWNLLSNWNSTFNLKQKKKEMLKEIKEFLLSFLFIDAYAGYQVVSDLWKNCLELDLPYIQEKGLHEAARLKVPNMVEKGSGSSKHLEQDGLRSAIVPTELIKSEFMKDKLDNILKLNSELDALKEEFENIKEANLSSEESVLSDYLKDDDSEELDQKKIKAGLKRKDIAPEEYAVLSVLENVNNKITNKKKEIKIVKLKLEEQVQEKIENLTKEEVELLMHKKWFSELKSDVEKLLIKPLNKDLDDLNGLIQKYSYTISDIDNQIQSLEADLEEFKRDLVRVYE